MNASAPLDPRILLAEAAWLSRLAREIVRDPHEAEELAQDVLLAAWTAREAPHPATLRAWLATALRRLAWRSHNRRDAREVCERFVAREGVYGGAAEEVERVELQRVVVEAVLALPEPYRSAVILRHLDGLTQAEIAHRQETSEDNARQRVSRGIALLRERLGRRGERLEAFLAPLAFAPRGRALPVQAASVAVPVFVAFCVLAALSLAVWLAVRPVAPARAVIPKVAGAREPATELEVAHERSARTAVAAPEPFSSRAPLVVRVTDAHGAPGSGVALTVERELGRELSVPEAQAFEHVADRVVPASGVVELSLARGAPFDVSARGPGGELALATSVYAGEIVELQLAPPVHLRGSVVDARTTEPIAGARVTAWTNDAARRRVCTVTTDVSGRFESAALPALTVWVEISAAGHATPPWRSVDLSLASEAEFDVALERGVRVAGVVSRVDGTPVAGARVGAGWRLASQVATDESGRFVLDGVSRAGNFEVHVRAPGCAPASRLPAFGDADEVELAFTLTRGRSCRGRVLTPDGSPCADALVATLQSTRTLENVPERFHSVTHTAADGHFAIDELDPALAAELVVFPKGGAPWLIDVARADSPEPVELGDILIVDAELRVCTLVDENGRALAGFDVEVAGVHSASWPARTLDRRTARSDARGEVALPVEPGADYEVLVRGAGAGLLVRAPFEHGGRVCVPAARTFAGQVVDSTGAPIAGASVRITTADGVRRAGAHTGADGNFRFTGLGAHPLDVVVAPDAWSGAATRHTFATTFLRGVAPVETLQITVAPAAPIRGVVRDENGLARGRARVRALTRAGDVLECVSNADGTFVLAADERELYVLEAALAADPREPARSVRRENVRAGASDVVLVVRAASR